MRTIAAPWSATARFALIAAGLFAVTQPADEIGQLRAENLHLRAQLLEARSRVSQLSVELNRLGDRWATRELDLIRLQREWASWQEGGAISEGLRLLMGLPEEPDEIDAIDSPEPEPDPDVVRATELRVTLEALLRAEGIGGFQPFELGRVLRDDDGEPSGVGPVLVRMFDDRRRPTGHLTAERLWLEASRGGRTVTLVFENGAHSRGGQSLPFAQGVHRTTLRHVDPTPFFERTPELFPSGTSKRPTDDGLWSHPRLSFEFNRLLGADPSVDRYRLEYFDGISGEDWIGVELSVRDKDGRAVRRLFADRMRLSIPGEAAGVRIELTGGVSIRGDEQIPFLDGRLRLVLPRADLRLWRKAGLPGLSSPGQEAEGPEAAGG